MSRAGARTCRQGRGKGRLNSVPHNASTTTSSRDLPVALGSEALMRPLDSWLVEEENVGPEICCGVWRLVSGGENGNECGVGAADGERGGGLLRIRFG